MRYVSCRQAEGLEVQEQFCDASSRPSAAEACSNGDCIGKWRSGAWTEVLVIKYEQN